MNDDKYTHIIYIGINNKIYVQNVTNQNTISISKNYKIEKVTPTEAQGNTEKIIKVFGIIGILKIGTNSCLMYISQRSYVDSLKDEGIYKIKEVDFLKMQWREDAEVNNTIILLKAYLAKNFYYSFGYDLTVSYTNMVHTNNDYLFNKDLIIYFDYNNISPLNDFVPFIINGFFGKFGKDIDNIHFDLYLIVRRNFLKVFNCCYQYEVVIKVNNQDIFNYTINSIENQADFSLDSFKNFKSDFERYFEIKNENKYIIINCVPNAFKEKVDGFFTLNMKYDYYSFGFDKIVASEFSLFDQNFKNFIKRNYNEIVDNVKFTVKRAAKVDLLLIENDDSDEEAQQNISQNREIVLISSGAKYKAIDIVQRIIWESIRYYIKSEISISGEFDALFGLLDHQTIMENGHITLNHEDSFSYEFEWLMYSFKRFYLSLRQNEKEVMKFCFLTQKTKANIMNTSIKPFTIFIGTWNLCAFDLDPFKPDIDIMDYLYPKDYREMLTGEDSPDFYVLGFQEIVKLNPNHVLFSSNKPKVDLWKQKLESLLTQKYELLESLNLVGVALFFFVRREKKPEIKKMTTQIIKTGFFGALGNKGSCLIQFQYRDKTFGFSCGHFASGAEHNIERLKQLREVMTAKPQFYSKENFLENDFCFVFGDLNFRVDLPIPTCEKYLYTEYLKLLDFDQFLVNKTPYKIPLEEGQITFQPTYKFLKGKSEYNLKKRTPSWCDRIFYKKNERLKQICYNTAMSIHYSDHVPVYSIFEVS